MKKFLIISAVLFGVVSTENCFCMDDQDGHYWNATSSVRGKSKLKITTVITTEGMVSNEQQSRTLTRKLLDFSEQVCVLEEKLQEASDREQNLIQDKSEIEKNFESLKVQLDEKDRSITMLENQFKDEKQKFEESINSIVAEMDEHKKSLDISVKKNNIEQQKLSNNIADLNDDLRKKTEELTEQTRYISDMRTFDKYFKDVLVKWGEISKGDLSIESDGIVVNTISRALETAKKSRNFKKLIGNLDENAKQELIESVANSIFNQFIPHIDCFDESFISFKNSVLEELKLDPQLSDKDGDERENIIVEIMMSRSNTPLIEYYDTIFGNSYQQSITDFLNEGDNEIIDVITRSALSISSQTI